MFSFFQRKNIVSDIEWLGVDMHSHLLPGIDDGSTSIENTIIYIKKLQELGLSKLICTPHIFPELYPNTSSTIFPVLSRVQEEVKLAGVQVELSAAAEYMVTAEFVPEKGLLTLTDNFLLIEMSYISETINIEKMVFDLQLLGYTVVLAHPERYRFYHTNFIRYQNLKDQGCLFQLNLLSLSSYYGKDVKHVANELLTKKLYDFAGTDLHHERHLNKLTDMIRSGDLYKLVGTYEFMNQQLITQSIIND
jgi:protein-tyrosine phosphatase